jgi:hypothetical protein
MTSTSWEEPISHSNFLFQPRHPHPRVRTAWQYPCHGDPGTWGVTSIWINLDAPASSPAPDNHISGSYRAAVYGVHMCKGWPLPTQSFGNDLSPVPRSILTVLVCGGRPEQPLAPTRPIRLSVGVPVVLHGRPCHARTPRGLRRVWVSTGHRCDAEHGTRASPRMAEAGLAKNMW